MGRTIIIYCCCSWQLFPPAQGTQEPLLKEELEENRHNSSESTKGGAEPNDISLGPNVGYVYSFPPLIHTPAPQSIVPSGVARLEHTGTRAPAIARVASSPGFLFEYEEGFEVQ